MRAVALWSLTLLAACGPVDLVVVNVSADGGFQPPGTACMSNADCLGGQYCSTMRCGGTGTCKQRPPSCAGEHDPECGCDGVTYFNPCLRRSAGVGFASKGLCEAARVCDTTTPCEAGQYCARLVFTPTECNANVSGACWVLPAGQCEPGPVPEPTFTPCGSGTCLRVCEALARQTPVLIRPQMSGPCP